MIYYLLWFRFRLWKNLGSGSGCRQYLAQFFNIKKFVLNHAFSMLEASLFSRKLASLFRFFDFWIPFYVDLHPNLVPELDPEPEYVPVSLRQKFEVAQHCMYSVMRRRVHHWPVHLLRAGVLGAGEPGRFAPAHHGRVHGRLPQTGLF